MKQADQSILPSSNFTLGFISWRIATVTTVDCGRDGDIGYVGGFVSGDEYLGRPMV